MSNSNAPKLDRQVTAKERLISHIATLEALPQVEALILKKLESDAPLLEEIPQYLLSLGGKRMRPVLTLLCARAFGMKIPSSQVLDVAAGIELIHMATLLHDDIIDKSPLRRHQASPFVKFGIDSTLLSGDFLLVRAFSLCARLDSFTIDQTEVACVELTEGEILETPLYRSVHSIESSLNIARRKTASLFRLAAVSGSHFSGAGVESVKQMSEFGESLGIAFQVLDDILDVTSDEDLLGKKSGTDLRERKPSLINVLWLASNSGLAQHLKKAPDGDEEAFVTAALNELRAPGNVVVTKARSVALEFAEKARKALQQAAKYSETKIDLETLEGIESLIDYTLERVE